MAICNKTVSRKPGCIQFLWKETLARLNPTQEVCNKMKKLVKRKQETAIVSYLIFMVAPDTHQISLKWNIRQDPLQS